MSADFSSTAVQPGFTSISAARYGGYPEFSSDTLTDLQTVQQQLDQARDIAVRLEQENARMVDALQLISRHGCESFVAPYNCQWGGLTRGANYGADAWCDPCIALDALAAAPVDGAE